MMAWLILILYSLPIIPVWRRSAWRIANHFYTQGQIDYPLSNKGKTLDSYIWMGIIWGFFLGLFWPGALPFLGAKKFVLAPKDIRMQDKIEALERENKLLDRKLAQMGVSTNQLERI